MNNAKNASMRMALNYAITVVFAYIAVRIMPKAKAVTVENSVLKMVTGMNICVRTVEMHSVR